MWLYPSLVSAALMLLLNHASKFEAALGNEEQYSQTLQIDYCKHTYSLERWPLSSSTIERGIVSLRRFVASFSWGNMEIKLGQKPFIMHTAHLSCRH